MQFLLDTHSFLWFANGDARLSDFARSVIADDANNVFVSVASVWEMAIKVRIGKLELDEQLSIFLARELPEFEVLHISVEHAVKTASLSLHHRDPFDRLLAAQALLDELPLISIDAIFDNYGVERLWTSASNP
jgi:PIN domain nuclease of toxin-antitoxin system